MIEVEHLSKRFGGLKAVDRVSFAVGRGEIVGLLGPNGAGKTTTMRMLTTYLPPTSGRATLAGHDILDAPIGVRRSVGYLPENVPLYGEMRVREYLRFRARLKDVPRRERRAEVEEAVRRTALLDVCDRVIGNLSRGYRQRVGLADALLGDPDVLILDEPTAGLDPIQIGEVRGLIRDLGLRHTILLSTHILPEVEAACGRVIIITGGRIAVDDSLERLKVGRAVRVEAAGAADAIRAALETLDGVGSVRTVAPSEPGVGAWEVRGSERRKTEDLREPIAKRVIQNGWGLRRLDLTRSTLEERFVRAVQESAAGAAPNGPGFQAPSTPDAS